MEQVEFFLIDGAVYDSEGKKVGIQDVIDSNGIVYTEDGDTFVP